MPTGKKPQVNQKQGFTKHCLQQNEGSTELTAQNITRSTLEHIMDTRVTLKKGGTAK